MEHFYGALGLTRRVKDEFVSEGLLSVRDFGKRQLILQSDEDSDLACVVLSGIVLLESMNLDGQRRILDYYEAGDVFWRKSLPEIDRGLYYFITGSKSQVAFMNYKKISGKADNDNTEEKICRALLVGSQQKSFFHINVLGQRSLRQKLIAYLEYLSRRRGKPVFMLPVSWTECADYLAVDRTAMMRELGKLKDEGILTAQGRKIELLSHKQGGQQNEGR